MARKKQSDFLTKFSCSILIESKVLNHNWILFYVHNFHYLQPLTLHQRVHHSLKRYQGAVKGLPQDNKLNGYTEEYLECKGATNCHVEPHRLLPAVSAWADPVDPSPVV